MPVPQHELDFDDFIDRNGEVTNFEKCTPRRLFGVMKWNEFVLSLLNSIATQIEPFETFNDPRASYFEGFVLLSIHYFLKGSAIPKKSELIWKQYRKLVVLGQLDLVFGMENPEYTPSVKRWLKKLSENVDDEIGRNMTSLMMSSRFLSKKTDPPSNYFNIRAPHSAPSMKRRFSESSAYGDVTEYPGRSDYFNGDISPVSRATLDDNDFMSNLEAQFNNASSYRKARKY